MAQTKMQDFQMVHDAALPVLGKVARTSLKDIVDGAHTNFEVPYRIYAAATPDSKLYFKSNFVPDSDGGGRSTAPVLGSIPSLANSTIDFQTRLTTGATFTITWPSSTLGRFRRFGFILKSTGTIQVVYSAEAINLSALAAINPGEMFADIDGWYIGYVDMEATVTASTGFSKFKTAGSATSVVENSVSGTPRIYRLISAYETGLNVKNSVVNAKGDILVASSDNIVTSLTVGPNSNILISDSASPTGVKWGTQIDNLSINQTLGIGTSSPQAALDVNVTGSLNSSIIVPRDTVANRPVSPVNGMLRYATDTNRFEMYQNGAWTNITASSGYSATVGSAAQVLAGVATHTSIDAALSASSPGDRILVLTGTYTETVNWSINDIALEGSGRLCLLQGTLKLSGSGNQVLGIKVDGELNLTGSNYCFMRAWISSSTIFTAGGTGNALDIIQE
jgi:hypothetical protein